MKGLLLKDWYMMRKYCRIHLLIVVIFTALSFIGDQSLLFVFYPCMLCGMIPVNLLSYDERSHWQQYSGTMPYTRGQLVSAKFLIGVFLMAAILLVTGIAQGVRMAAAGSFSWGDLGVLMLIMVISETLMSSVALAVVFRWGVEKGRIAYYVVIGMYCGFGVLLPKLFLMTDRAVTAVPLALLALAGVGIYALAWYLSIVFYRRREV